MVFFYSISSLTFLFPTGTLSQLRLPVSFPSRNQSWRRWQFCQQLSTARPLPSAHPSPPTTTPTHFHLPTQLPTGRLARSPSGWLGTPTQLPLPSTQMDLPRRNRAEGGTRCSLVLETVARRRFPPRSWVIKKLEASGFWSSQEERKIRLHSFWKTLQPSCPACPQGSLPGALGTPDPDQKL